MYDHIYDMESWDMSRTKSSSDLALKKNSYKIAISACFTEKEEKNIMLWHSATLGSKIY